jgi:hypothetical protein
MAWQPESTARYGGSECREYPRTGYFEKSKSKQDSPSCVNAFCRWCRLLPLKRRFHQPPNGGIVGRWFAFANSHVYGFDFAEDRTES